MEIRMLTRAYTRYAKAYNEKNLETIYKIRHLWVSKSILNANNFQTDD